MKGEGRGTSVKPPLVDDLGLWKPSAFLHVQWSGAASGQRAPLAVVLRDGLPYARTPPISSSRRRCAMSG
jgi:hypothetical protein